MRLLVILWPDQTFQEPPGICNVHFDSVIDELSRIAFQTCDALRRLISSHRRRLSLLQHYLHSSESESALAEGYHAAECKARSTWGEGDIERAIYLASLHCLPQKVGTKLENANTRKSTITFTWPV